VGVVIFFSLFVAFLLVCTPKGERGLALGSTLTVGAVILFIIRINLHRIVGDLFGDATALLWSYRNDLLLAFAAAIVLVVPIVMIYMSVSDQVHKKQIERERQRLRGIGFPLRSEHPMLWLMDEKRSTRLASRFRRKNVHS
jgi:hypothetical protein